MDEWAHNWHNSVPGTGTCPNERHSSHSRSGVLGRRRGLRAGTARLSGRGGGLGRRAARHRPRARRARPRRRHGQATRQLVPLGARVVAVEPIDAMRAELSGPSRASKRSPAPPRPSAPRRQRRRRHLRAGSWFRPDEAVQEISASSVPAAAWRCSGTAAISTIQARSRRRAARSASQRVPVAARSTGARSSARSSSGPGGTRRRLTLAEYVDRVASTSFVGAMTPDGDAVPRRGPGTLSASPCRSSCAI